jgi:hypothetical protein
MDPDGTQYGFATKLRISPVTTNAAATWNQVLPTTRRHQGFDRGGVVVSVTSSRYLFAVRRADGRMPVGECTALIDVRGTDRGNAGRRTRPR